MVKFNNKLTDYRYVLSFDIAKYKTGYSLLDIKNNKVVLFGTIVCSDSIGELIWADLYTKVCLLLLNVYKICGNDKFFITKERLPAQAGSHTTISTLQSLAKAHAIIDLACIHNGVELYDEEGVHTISVKAFYKKKLDIEKPTKQDIAKNLALEYPEISKESNQLDMTDSLAVAITLLNVKWDSDIMTKKKELRKEIKNFKTEKKKQELLHEIEMLDTLLLKGE